MKYVHVFPIHPVYEFFHYDQILCINVIILGCDIRSE